MQFINIIRGLYCCPETKMIYHISHHLRVIRRSADTRGEGACLSGLQCFKQHFPYSTPTGSDKTYHQWLFTMKVSPFQLDWIAVLFHYFVSSGQDNQIPPWHYGVLTLQAQLQNRIIVITGQKLCWLVVYIFFSCVMYFNRSYSCFSFIC